MELFSKHDLISLLISKWCNDGEPLKQGEVADLIIEQWERIKTIMELKEAKSDE